MCQIDVTEEETSEIKLIARHSQEATGKGFDDGLHFVDLGRLRLCELQFACVPVCSLVEESLIFARVCEYLFYLLCKNLNKISNLECFI